MVATEVWQPRQQHYTESLLSLVVAQITHSPFAIAKNVHGAFTKQSLRSFGIPAMVLSTLSRFASGGPAAAKQTIYGNIICRRWSGGTSCGGGPAAA